ncbi:MAG: hypothetical protein OEW15_17430 [Nitrospirota bacterium]|nr:hypothetical protein [Nitrospirota bacterium]
MPKIADVSREANKAVLQAAVNQAQERISKEMRGIPSWTIVDLQGTKATRALRSFGAVSEDDARAVYPVGEGPSLAKQTLERERARWKDSYLGAEQLPVVPRSAFVHDPGEGKPDYPVQPLMLEQAARLCQALGVDAVLIVQIGADVDHPRENTFMVKENRTDGTVRMAQTLTMVDRSGRIIADLGPAELDGRSAFRDMLPIYVGAGRDAVKPENIDLGDPKKKTVQAFRSLIEETSSDMTAQFRKDAGL